MARQHSTSAPREAVTAVGSALRRRLPPAAAHRLRYAKWAVTGSPPPAPSRRGGPSPLEQYFRSNDRRLIHKWNHYFDIYHRHFERFRGREVTIVEFGVFHGGSLQMWRHYFGPQARIFGIDIDPRCKALAEPGTEILIGDQQDRAFLRHVAERTGPIDVVIEDGGHRMGQQIATFEEIYPRMARNGVFLIEDLCTSYWSDYGGGYQRPGTFIEYAKGLTDKLNAWHSREPGLTVDEFTRSTRSIHVYNGVVVFERGRVKRPSHEMTGRPSW